MKTIVVFSTLLAILHANTYKMVLQSTGSFRDRTANNLNLNDQTNEDIPNDEILKKQLVPFRDYYDEFYLGNVTIGTPGQTMSLVMDTGSANFWVFDSTCRAISCLGFRTAGFTRSKFNTRRSSTFRRQRNSIDFRSLLGSCSGPVGKDVVSFAGATIENQDFIHATDAGNSFFYMPIDGILGLGWPAITVGKVTSPIQSILPSLDAPLFTVWLGKKVDTTTRKAGLITFGAIDTTNCHSEINYVPLSKEGYWQFELEGFSVGSFSENKKQQVISSTSATWIGAPAEIIKSVANQTGALYDSMNKFYTLDCSTMKTQPDLVFTINGMKYNVPSEEYVLDIGIEDGQCVLAFFDNFPGSAEIDWVLSEAWIRTYCNIYDFGQKRIGFSKAIHQEI